MVCNFTAPFIFYLFKEDMSPIDKRDLDMVTVTGYGALFFNCGALILWWFIDPIVCWLVMVNPQMVWFLKAKCIVFEIWFKI